MKSVTLEALSTLAAVIVSLVIALWAQRATRTKLVASIYVVDLIFQDRANEKPPQYINVSITNTGSMPLRIKFIFLYFKFPFSWGGVFAISPLDSFAGDPYIQQRTYPVEIAPRSNQQFQVSTPDSLKRK